MSTLKVNKIRDTAGSADSITLDPNGGAVIAGVTTMTTARVTSGIVTNTFIVGAGVTISSDGDVFTTGITTSSTVIVGSGVTISESGIEASGIGITVANINGAKVGGKRNIWINGGMDVAQRSTSTTGTGYCLVDRWVLNNNAGTITKTQHDLTSSDTGPWEQGIRHAIRMTNTSAIGSGAGDYAECYYRPEARDLAMSGWDYNNANSFITLSYWARASVAQAYPATIKMGDWDYYFPWNFTIAQANVWQKFAIKIHGHSSMTINNDNGIGFTLWINAYQGSNYFSGSYTANDWNAESGSYMFAGSPTTTWGTTTGATWDITGFQLEVGPEATAFENRSYIDELAACQRYYYTQSSAYFPSPMSMQFQFPTIMRTAPTITHSHSGSPTINNITDHGFMGYNSGNTIAAYAAAAEL